MVVRLFQSRFAPLVKSGAKLQTVRPVPKRMPKVGDAISLREWTGKPYRSPQRVLKESVITRVSPIKMDSECGISVDGWLLCHIEEKEFAQADGFKDSTEMIQWFAKTHGLPFYGICIVWK